MKWVGGKRQILSEIEKRLPKEFGTYFEPFVGGGALLFHLQPRKAVINDFNSELINAYQVVKNEPQSLLTELEEHTNLHSESHYYEVRSWDRTESYLTIDSIQRAARFIYLNKTGFNGLFRVNKNNENNVPMGTYKNPIIKDENTIIADSKILKYTTILNGDFVQAVSTAKKGDLVYFDPPYIPVNATSNFTSYTSLGFTLDDQIRLRDLIIELTNRGVFAMMSNADVPLVYELYNQPEFKISKIKASRAINSNASKRGKVGEVLVRNYE
ncbi:MAG: DNA adenine methylase [Lactobacillaceae bacterium]|nr:DNA adenine methylase [Lactobacillaceae bacterium]